MSCPVWDLPQPDREMWDFGTLCDAMGCPECTAEPGDIPWMDEESKEEQSAASEFWDIPF